MNEIVSICKNVRDILLSLHSNILTFFRESHSLTLKEDQSIVTKADLSIESTLRSSLHDLLPSAYILGEENSHVSEDEYERIFQYDYLWVIDPIDGTENFLNHLPFFATSVGLLEKTKNGHVPLLGAVLMSAMDELICTIGENVYTIQCSSRREKEVTISSPAHVSPVMLSESFFEKYHFTRGKGNPRIVGSTVVNLAYTALGRSRGSLTGAHLWDFAGAAAIGRYLQISFYDFATQKPKNSFDAEDFMIGDTKTDWRVKQPLLFCREDQLSILTTTLA